MENILIVEKDVNYCIDLINIIIKNHKELKLVGVATTVDDALNCIKNDCIDIILINAEMIKDIDIKYLKKYENSIIILTNSNTKFVCKYYTQSYQIINKQEDIGILNQKLNDLVLKNRKVYNVKDLREIIKDELIHLEYNQTYKGFDYLIETLFLLINLEEYSEDNLSKNIYPIVAKKFDTSPSNVKYNIRNATVTMYFDCPVDKLSNYLGFNVSSKKPKTKTIICIIENNIRKKTNYSY